MSIRFDNSCHRVPYRSLRIITMLSRLLASASRTQKTSFLCAGLFLISFSLFAFLSANALINGDAALYVQQIVHLDFAQRTIHLGYFLLGSPFIHLLPLPPDYALNLMSCFFGALCTVLIYLIACTTTQNHRVAFIAVLVLLTNYLFVVNAVFAEVYVPQLFFFLLAVQCVLLQKAIPAGLSFALSFLITPSALFGLPSLLLLQRDKRAMLQLTTPAFIVVLLALLPNADDYFVGGRGLLKAVRIDLALDRAFLKEGRELFNNLFCYAPFLLAGSVYIMRNKRLHALGGALISLWFFSFIFGEKFGDVPVQLPTYVLLSLVGGIGFQYLLDFRHGKRTFITSTLYLLLIFCLSITGLFTFRRIEETRHTLIDYRDTAHEINQRAHHDYLVVGEWTQGILFEHYIFQRPYTDVWINTEWLSGDWGQRMQKASKTKLHDARASGREIWLLGNDSSLIPDLHEQGYVIEPFRSCYRARLNPPKD